MAARKWLPTRKALEMERAAMTNPDARSAQMPQFEA